MPSAYHARLGALFLHSMGIVPACADVGEAGRVAAPSEYGLGALLAWDASMQAAGASGGALCAARAPLPSLCASHLLALLGIGLGLRALAFALLLASLKPHALRLPCAARREAHADAAPAGAPPHAARRAAAAMV